jgi:hypothetical protein
MARVNNESKHCRSPSLTSQWNLYVLYLMCSVIDVFVFVGDSGRLVEGFSMVMNVVGQSKTKKHPKSIVPPQTPHHAQHPSLKN